MHMKWTKYILGVGSRNSNIAVSAELGRYPLIIKIMCTVVKYWFRMSKAKTDSLLHDCYKSNVQSIKNGENCWLSTIENLGGRSNFHNILNVKTATKKLKCYLENVFDQQFHIDLNRDERNGNKGNKLRTYSMFKDSISQEKYRKVRQNITKLCICAHNPKIGTGRHTRPHKMPLENRTYDTAKVKLKTNFIWS